MNHTRWFQEIGAAEVELVGGKGANLGEMVGAGMPVPPGFCLTASAYREFVEATGLAEPIRAILNDTDLDDPTQVEAQAARIRHLVTQQPVPAAIGQELVAAYHRLGQVLGLGDVAHMPVAVRSSATAEDLPTASFAGQQDTYLNVRGELDLLDRVRDCWASLWTDRAIVYRTQQGFDHHRVYLAVVVQAMIPAEVAGILFTANPVTGDRDQAVVNASWGLGEAIVSGLVTPDTFVVHKGSGEVVSRQIASKECSIEYGPDGGTVELATPAKKRQVPALSDGQLSELVTLAQVIETHYGAPQDIEWAYAGGQFYILQSRAITTLAPPVERAATEYNRAMFVELFPDPLSPAFLSAIQPLFHSMLDFTFRGLGFEPPQGMEAVGVFYNQPYFNRDYIAAAFRSLSPVARERLIAQIVNPWGHHERGLQGELSLPFLGMVARLLRFMVSLTGQLPDLVSQHQAEVAEAAKLSLEEVSEAELVGRTKRMVFGSARRLLDHDFLLIALIGITYQMLGSLLERYFGEDTEELRAKLVSGVTGNVTMESNKHLWDLSRIAKASPAVSELLHTHGEREVMDLLGGTPEAQTFLEALRRFLAEHGHREIRMDILYPTWGEDPTPVLGFVRSYLDADEAQSPHRQQARLVEERREQTQTMRDRVEQDLVGRILVSPLLRWVLGHTQANTRERDTVHFELTRIFPPFRRLLLELGRRWSERGLLAQADDIFFLTLDEMEAVAANPHPMQEQARARREELEVNRSRPCPDMIRGDQEIFAHAAVPVEEVEGRLQGIASSPGTVTGVARVIRGPEDFGKLQKNDILVAPLTNPVWTPLFAIASGVITEVGGILSHGAIVAREYGIPAVMSVAGVTRQVLDGQMITLDGSKGFVHLGVEAVP